MKELILNILQQEIDNDKKVMLLEKLFQSKKIEYYPPVYYPQYPNTIQPNSFNRCPICGRIGIHTCSSNIY